MKHLVRLLLLVVVLGAAWLAWRQPAPLTTLWSQVQQQAAQALGVTDYTTVLRAGKQALTAQSQLITARVTRQEHFTQTIAHTPLVKLLPQWQSKATVQIDYQVEYNFGYPLAPNDFELRYAHGDILVEVQPAQLVSHPAISQVKHRVLETGVLINEQAALLALSEQTATHALAQGQLLQNSDEVRAQCERQLITFVRGFVQQSAPNQAVPAIRIVYR